jgi:hypothetical protein
MSQASRFLVQVSNDFNELQREYMLFFSDVTRVEPYQLKEELLSKVKRLRQMSGLRTDEQFKANNLIARVQSHIQLWARQLERKYAGTDRPRPKPAQAAKPKPEPEATPENKKVTIGDPSRDRDQVVTLYDEYTRLNLLLGARKMVNFAKFKNYIGNQTQKIQKAKQTDKVTYEVLIQDQKVVIKSKTKKN